MAEGNGEVTRELKVWQGRSFKMAVLVGVFVIAGAVIALGDRFLFTESEGTDLKNKFERHEDWGKEKYQEINAKFDKLLENQEMMEEKLDAMLLENGVNPILLEKRIRQNRKPG